MNNNQKLPEKYVNHFNEMKELLDNLPRTEEEFMTKAKEIGLKHFGHEGIVIDMPTKKETE